MKPSLRNLFVKKLTCDRVAPIISASVSWLIATPMGAAQIAACHAGCLTIRGDPQLSHDRVIRHKPLQRLSLAQCFPASAQPPFLTNLLWSHESVVFFISAKFAEASAACRNLSMQTGVRAATTAVAARFVARVSARHSAGRTAAFVSLEISMIVTLTWSDSSFAQ